VLLIAAVSIACGGGGGASSPTAPTSSPAPSGPRSSAIVLVTNASMTVEPAATGVIYRTTLTLSEVSGKSAATIASIRLSFSNGTRNGSATFDSSDDIVTALASRGANEYQLIVTSDNPDRFTQVSFTVTYADSAGAGGSFTSPTATSITPVPAAFTPPRLTPGPASGKYDGVYNFSIAHPTSPTTSRIQNIARFMIIRDGIVSSADGTMAGSVDNFGWITFTWPCIITPNSLADFEGHMTGLAWPKAGKGSYDCRMKHDEPRTWTAQESR
jgi:hypothetical protein